MSYKRKSAEDDDDFDDGGDFDDIEEEEEQEEPDAEEPELNRSRSSGAGAADGDDAGIQFDETDDANAGDANKWRRAAAPTINAQTESLGAFLLTELQPLCSASVDFLARSRASCLVIANPFTTLSPRQRCKWSTATTTPVAHWTPPCGRT